MFQRTLSVYETSTCEYYCLSLEKKGVIFSLDFVMLLLLKKGVQASTWKKILKLTMVIVQDNGVYGRYIWIEDLPRKATAGGLEKSDICNPYLIVYTKMALAQAYHC